MVVSWEHGTCECCLQTGDVYRNRQDPGRGKTKARCVPCRRACERAGQGACRLRIGLATVDPPLDAKASN